MTEPTRFIDTLGRLVIPKDQRVKLGIIGKTKVFISADMGKITITTVEPACRICGCRNNINSTFELCSDCINKIKAI